MRLGHCGHDKLVAFSCKRRGFCRSCGVRPMAQTAAHLVEQVIPHVPVRQWVLSLPIPLRMLLAAQPHLVTPVLQVVHRLITRSLLDQVGVKPDEAESGAQAVAGCCLFLPHRLRSACWPEDAEDARRHAEGEGPQAIAARRHRRL